MRFPEVMCRVWSARGLLYVLIALWAVLNFSVPTFGQQERGYVIRILEHLVYVDVGTRDGVEVGDLYEVVRSEKVVHPVTGEEVGGVEVRVGAIQVTQVFEKMSVGEILEGDGEIKMLHTIKRVTDPERVSSLLSARSTGGAELEIGPKVGGGTQVKKIWGIAPGLYQVKRGHPIRGYSMMAAEVGLLAYALKARSSSSRAHDEYKKLPRGTPQEKFDDTFKEYERNGKRSRWLFRAVGAIYLYNLVEVLLLDRSVSGTGDGGGEGDIRWSVRLDGSPGSPRLNLSVPF